MSRIPAGEGPGRVLRRRRPSLARTVSLRAVRASLALALLAGLAAPPALRADTIFLKDGNQILDCQVIRETPTHVHVRTPVGDMGVPRDQIHRIQRVKTVYDRYAERLEAVRDDDARGLLRLALWCRSQDALRKEADTLLAKVVALDPKSTKARQLLGHIRVGREWVVPSPLSLRVRVSGVKPDEFLRNLDTFLEARHDVRLAPPAAARAGSRTGGSGSGSASASKSTGAEENLDECEVDVSVVIARRAAPRMYGSAIGQATFGTSVRMQARGSWVGRTRVRTSLDGQLPGNGVNADQGVRNALSTSSKNLHKFLDQLQALRAKKLQSALRKKQRAR